MKGTKRLYGAWEGSLVEVSHCRARLARRYPNARITQVREVSRFRTSRGIHTRYEEVTA